VLDVEANFFTVLAFRYTSITSVALFGALAIPGAMITSRWILKSNYGMAHLLGAGVCVLGVVANILVDYEYQEREHLPHKVLGDVLAISGGILYGVNDAIEELVVRKFSAREFLAMTGLFGFFLAALQVMVLERAQVFKLVDGSSDCSLGYIGFLLASFVFCNYLSYNGVARFLVISEAALLNLSLLTSDVYTVMFSIFDQGIVPNPLFFLAMLLIFAGVVIYESRPSPLAQNLTTSTIPKNFVLEFGTKDIT